MAERIHVRAIGGIDQVLTRLSQAGLERGLQVRAFDVGASPTVVTLAVRRPWWSVSGLVRGRCEIVSRDGITTTECVVAWRRVATSWMAFLGLLLVASGFAPLSLPARVFGAAAAGLLLVAWWRRVREESRRMFDCAWEALAASRPPEAEATAAAAADGLEDVVPRDGAGPRAARRRKRATLAGS